MEASTFDSTQKLTLSISSPLVLVGQPVAHVKVLSIVCKLDERHANTTSGDDAENTSFSQCFATSKMNLQMAV